MLQAQRSRRIFHSLFGYSYGRSTWTGFFLEGTRLFGDMWQRLPLPLADKVLDPRCQIPLRVMPPKSLVAKPAATPNAVQTLWKAYKDQTSDRLKFIDAFLFFLMLSGIAQFLYCVLVTDYPFNAFLAG